MGAGGGGDGCEQPPHAATWLTRKVFATRRTTMHAAEKAVFEAIGVVVKLASYWPAYGAREKLGWYW